MAIEYVSMQILRKPAQSFVECRFRVNRVIMALRQALPVYPNKKMMVGAL